MIAQGHGSLTYQLNIDRFSAKEIERFKTDEDFYRRFRTVMENDMNVSGTLFGSDPQFSHHLQSMHAATLRGSNLQEQATQLFEANMRRKLVKKPWIAESRGCFLSAQLLIAPTQS